MTTQIQEYSQTEAALSELRKRYADATYDVETVAGMKKAKDARAEVRGYRVNLEKMRKEIKSPALERCRLIDSEAKRITEELVALESPIDEQIKEHEARKEAERQAAIEAEEQRITAIQDRIASDIRGMAEAAAIENKSSEELQVWIDDLTALEIDESFAELKVQAHDAKVAALSRLRDIHAATVDREIEDQRIKAEREELAKLRAAEEERQAKERAKQEKAEAEARKKREAEQAAERKKLDAQRKRQAEEQAKIDAENKRIADERAAWEREQAEAKRRAEAEARAKSEAEAKAQEAARKARFPGQAAIVDALVKHFGVTDEVVKSWLAKIREAA